MAIKAEKHEFEATVGIKIGPVKANFKGEVELTDLNPPENYTISGEGKGGTADIVAYAIGRGTRLIHINPVNRTITRTGTL